jgi:hypothetical protein
MANVQSCGQWKVEPVSPAGFPDLDCEVVYTWGLFEDDEVQQQKKPQTIATHEHEKPDEPTRAEIASKLLQDLDEWIKEGMCSLCLNMTHVTKLLLISRRSVGT